MDKSAALQRNYPQRNFSACGKKDIDWYQQTLHATYPDLQLPGSFPFAETMAALNPDRPVCFVQYVEAAQIQCRAAYRY